MNLIFLGPPGAGKGTYALRICSQKNYAHVSTGDLLRAEAKNKSDLGLEAKKYMEAGGLVPDEIVIGMLKKRLEEPDCENGYILDGFPRTLPQAEALEEITTIDAVVNLIIPDWVLVEKILARRTCENCGDIYNIADIRFGLDKEYHMPPMNPKVEGKCDKCDGKLVSRSDETKDVIKERLRVYEEETEPLISHYREKGLLKDIEVTGPPEIMVPKITKVLKI